MLRAVSAQVATQTLLCRAPGCGDETASEWGPGSFCDPCQRRLKRAKVWRSKLAAQANLLRPTRTIEEVAAMMGVSFSYVSSLLADPDGSGEVERKKLYGGVCRSCGAPTSGSDGAALAPTECASCTRERQHDERYWTRESILAAFRAFHARHGRPPKVGDASPAHARAARARGVATVYHHDVELPVPAVVNREFGSWRQALRHARMPPRAAGTYERTPAIRVRMAKSQRLRGAGMAAYVVLAERDDGAWTLLGETTARDESHALESLLIESPEGRVVVLDARQWKPRAVRAEQRTVYTLVESPPETDLLRT